jgi:AcrR family transcriptional regulator
MSPARREVQPDDPSTRDALMDAALDQLTTKGVLAGLNLSEVADTVGVTPANIYYYFGTREGLLRAALAREAQRLQEPLTSVAEGGFVERRLAMFDAIGDIPTLALTALLALDDDKGYEPLPFLDATRQSYRAMADAGKLSPDLDVEAAHLVTLATSIGIAIYTEAVARQLDTTSAALRSRARTIFEQMLQAISDQP